MADRRLTARWVWISKQPGAVAYGIQATSSPQADFSGYVGRYVVGLPEPGTSANAPGSLPWVTFGPFVASADQILISVSIQDPPRDRDSSSREIFPQRLFLLSYQDLAALGVSYGRLWAALANAELSAADGRPLTFEVPEQPIDELIQTIERYGVERMTALAAMILEDRLVLADSTALTRRERLAVLDAALALLPYGFRAAVSGSSAVNNVITHVVEVVFAEFVNDSNKQVLVQLSDAAPIPLPQTKVGREYRDMLREKAREPGLRAVVHHLWGATIPCSLHGEQEKALEILATLDFDQSLIRGLHNRTASRAQIITLLSRDPVTVGNFWRAQAVTAPARRAALGLVLSGRDEASSRAALQAHWTTVADDLCAMASDDLDAGNPAFARWCLHSARAESADAEDRFLARLLASDQVVPSHRPKRLCALVQLLEAHEMPGSGSMPRTRAQLCQDQDETWAFQLFQSLLTRQVRACADPRRAIAWASWLCMPRSATPADLPSWATVLRVLCGADTGLDVRAVPDPANLAWFGVLLRLAASSGNFAGILVFIIDEIVELAWDTARKSPQSAAPDPGVASLLESLDVDLWPLRVPANIVARTDVARVLFGSTIKGFPGELEGGAVIYGYLDGLGYELGPRLAPNSRSWLAACFLELLVPNGTLTPGTICLLNTWSANPDLSSEVNKRIAKLDSGTRPLDKELDSCYWDSVAQMRELAGYASSPRLSAATRTAVAEPKTALARQTGPTGVNSTPLALACYNARLAGLSVKDILRVLDAAGANRICPRKLDDVLREFQGLVCHDPESATDGRNDLFACYTGIARGALGAPYARDFARELAIRSHSEISLRTDLIQRLEASRGTGQRALAGIRRLRLRRRRQRS